MRAFRGGNPHQRLVAISDSNLFGGLPPNFVHDKGRYQALDRVEGEADATKRFR